MKKLGETQSFKELFREYTELAVEIADECDAGDWVSPYMIGQYRTAKRKLEDFREQMQETGR